MFFNKIGVVVQSHFFEKELRKTFNCRCDYQKLLSFLTVDIDSAEENGLAFGSYLNNEGRANDIVRAVYFTAQTIYRGNGKGLEQRNNEAHDRFLNALRGMNYEVESAYNSIDAHFVVTSLQMAQSRTIDTMVFLGLTMDHVPLLWAIRSAGIRTIGMFADPHDVTERIKSALSWYYSIRAEDGFLIKPSNDRNENLPEESGTSEQTSA